jgi:iron complex outermembrane receptor protein
MRRVEYRKFALVALVAVYGMPCAHAQQGATEELEEIIVVGTRRDDRTAADTAVPVDVLDATLIESVSSPEMLDALVKLVPAMNVERFILGDGASMIRPPTLRGLDSDKTLVLVNGKRRHRGALVQLAGNGTHGPDLNALPAIALRSVEVLRDGASALYGSDAIAGVLNFNLREDGHGGEIRAQYGEYSEGGEASRVISANVGVPLGDAGFINISGEFTDDEQTSRGTYFNRTIGSSGLTPAESALVAGLYDHDGDPVTPEQQRFGPDAVTEVWAGGRLVTVLNGSDGIPDDTDSRFADNLPRAEISSDSPLVQVWGRPNRNAVSLVANAGLDLAGDSSLYGWASYSDSDIDRNMAHRRVGVGSLRMLRLPDGRIYDPREQYPAGFTPRFFGNVVDIGITAGWRGSRREQTDYDVSVRYGSSELEYNSKNTRNPSLGPDSPSEFRPGSLESEEIAVAADFTRPLALRFASETSLAFGIEWREERYGSRGGDSASWAVGPYIVPDPWGWETSATEAADGQNGGIVECRLPGLESVGTPCPAGDPIHNVFNVGSDGFPGYGPLSVFSYTRDSWAAYLDVEADVTDSWLLALAGRYEKYSDYGDNFSARVASRVALGEDVALRGSMGTGFRAPSAGQIATINVQGRPGTTTEPHLVGIFPATHPGAQAFGAEPLDAETSTQFTLGISATLFDALDLTIDLYRIDVGDRLWLSDDNAVGPDERAILVESGVPGANGIQFVKFFNNDIDTRTEGVDLVASYNVEWKSGVTAVSIAANWNRTEVTRRKERPGGPFVSDTDMFNIRNRNPYPRAVLDLRHSWHDDLSASIRGNWFGEYDVRDSRNPSLTQAYDSLIQVDLLLQAGFADDRYRITFGANNVFDERPAVAEFGVCCGVIWRRGEPVDWQGRFYFLRGEYRWD